MTNRYSLEVFGDTYALQAKNDGTLSPIRSFSVDLEGFAEFDISTATGYAYAMPDVGNAQTLYRIGRAKLH